MNAGSSINAQREDLSTAKEASLSAVSQWKPLQLVKTQGQLQIHTSTFRGSFSIVLSEALRSAGLGSNVLISQFLKGGVNQGPKGAINLCGRLEWLRPDIETCLPEECPEENLSFKTKYAEKAIQELWGFCKKRIAEKKLDKIVLDEIGMAISLGFIEESELISIIKNRPSSTDIILTGQSIPSQVIEMADQITQLRCN